jgi:hypothetical protein
MELETLIQLSRRLGYVSAAKQDDVLTLTDEIGCMLSGLKSSLSS